MEPRAYVEPGSCKHSVFTHFPKDPNCEICLKTKTTRASCRRRANAVMPRADNFGDLITADHKVPSEGCESRNNHRHTVVVQDVATQWLQSFPCKTKASQETQKSPMKFLEPTRKPQVIYTDNSLEFGKSCEELSRNHCTSTPHRSETNGIAERAVRRVKEETSAVLLQSGLDNEWSADSMEFYCYLRSIQDKLSGGKTYGSRFGMPFNLPVIPFGAMVEYHPISAKDQSRIWKRDIEELEEMDAQELRARRLNAKEVLTPQRSGDFVFPVAVGTVKIFGWERLLRTSTLTQDPPERDEEQHIFQGYSDEWYTPSHHEDDSIRDDEEAKHDFWTITGEFNYRHHVVPRELYVPKEATFPIPMWYIDVTRTTYVTGRNVGENIEDYWNVVGEREREHYQMHGRISQDSS